MILVLFYTLIKYNCDLIKKKMQTYLDKMATQRNDSVTTQGAKERPLPSVLRQRGGDTRQQQ